MPSSYALGPRFEAMMTELIQSGRYNSKSGPGIPIEEVFDRLTAKYEQMAKDQGLL